MANKKLRRTGLPAELCNRLSRHQIETCQDFLSLTPLELMRMAGQSYQQVQKLLLTVSQVCAPKMTTALELRDRRSCSYFPTSLRGLDRVLNGGLACGTLTEVTGPSGCGKTQFCMMLSVLATLPRSMGGLDSAVVYIDSESAFSAERLVEIALNRFPQYFSAQERLSEMAERIYLFRELTCQSVLKRLQSLEEDIISKKVGLVIVDSIASVVRKEFDTSLPGNLSERSNLLVQQAARLKYLAEEFAIPVLLTNQITTHLRVKDAAPAHEEQSIPAEFVQCAEDSGYVTAALGNTWSHSVNTRLIVQYLDSQRRQIIVAKSPVAPFAVFNYTLQKDGLHLEGLPVQSADVDSSVAKHICERPFSLKSCSSRLYDQVRLSLVACAHTHGDENQASSTHQGTDPGLQPIRVRSAFSYSLTEAKPPSDSRSCQ